MPQTRYERTVPWEASFGLALPYMKQALKQESTFNAFYRAAKDVGFSYRRARMLEDWRATAGLFKYEAPLHAMDPDRDIPSAYTVEGPAGQQAAYRAIVDYKFTDYTTGETLSGTRVITSSRLMSTGRYEHAAAAAFEPGRPYADPTARDFRLRTVERRRDL
jgi:hypothetical protein